MVNPQKIRDRQANAGKWHFSFDHSPLLSCSTSHTSACLLHHTTSRRKKTQTLLSSLKFLLKESCIVSRQTKSLLKITCIFSQGKVNPCWRRAMKTIRLQSNSGRITATKITFLSGILWLFFFFWFVCFNLKCC